MIDSIDSSNIAELDAEIKNLDNLPSPASTLHKIMDLDSKIKSQDQLYGDVWT